jgi:hypothetical protein
MSTVSMIAAVSGAALAGAASGQVDLSVGSFGLAPTATVMFEFDVGPGMDVLGITFKGDYTDDGPGGNWASDTRMVVEGPTDSVAGGGYDTASDYLWQFDGPGSDASGFYADTHLGVISSSAEGKWKVTFKNDYSFGIFVKWDNVVVTLETVPAPASAALLGLGGLVALRRRR